MKTSPPPNGPSRAQQAARRSPPAVLHVGVGFRPWLINGLITYAENLMQGQVSAGARVGYFFAGRHLPGLRQPRLHRWRRRGVRMYEWLNSPVVIGAHRGSPDPERDLSEPQTEAAFERVLREFQPDLVHIYDLGGLPTRLITIARERSLVTVMTLQDYQPLCPTIKLFDVDGERCYRLKPGEQCARCCANAPHDNGELRLRTLAFEVKRVADRVPGASEVLAKPLVARAAVRFGSALASLGGRRAGDAPISETPPAAVAPAAAYQRRRDVNVERLNQLNALLANSDRTGGLYIELGVERHRLRRTHVTLNHLSKLRVERVAGTSPIARFAALNVAVSVQKGSFLLVDALEQLRRAGRAGRYRMLIAGWVPDDIREMLREHDEVEYTGPYRTEDLNGILAEVDVGLIPSIWEDVYPSVGLEFLAKGIPIIGNNLGGIPEYCRDGETGWLNDDNSARGLAERMGQAIDDPEGIQARSRQAAAQRDRIVRPFSDHVEEVYSIYDELLDGNSPEAEAAALVGDEAERDG